MSYLILVKHSSPAINTRRSAHAWPLSDEGRRRCAPLAARLVAYAPTRVVASREPKATETGEIVAARLGVPFETWDGLGEHDRRGVPFGPTAQFEADVARFFAQPAALVHGRETADAAHARFSAALEGVLAQYPDDTLVVVTHGTVLSLWVSRLTQTDPYPLWQSLGLPSFVVLTRPELTVETVVTSAT
jgi:broad specificity phosphatase PhoE